VIGVAGIAEAAKKELGSMLREKPIRISCPMCGTHVVSVLSAPTMMRGRCSRCRVDVIALVSKEGEALVATERTG
jgi:hypothetical protein